MNLFLGSNGTGKSTVFEVLQKIQLFISGDSKIEAIFKSKDCTRWQISKIQRFELEILNHDGVYRYELGINHENQDKCRVDYEHLWFDNQLLLKFELGNVEIFKDNYTKESQYSFIWSQSVLPSLLSKADNTKITWFKERIARFIIVRVIPSLMQDESHQQERHLASQMENYLPFSITRRLLV
ncbi:hypothetical protein [Dulcicalothrix desertica]|uniref:hypothetical protein n=1 Tax=Dulcicalothrix desertica TaxID=32056 RepID=UPI001F448090|nr:hypothetical protein [Dulcicalothrix desertica]